MTPKALLLTPGAGSDRNQSTLLAVEAALPQLVVERVDFPYRLAGRKAPDRAPVLIECVRQAAAALAVLAACDPTQLLLGGRSMGGRMCSMAVAEGLPAAGLVLISYPLHPPGAPHKLRTAHLNSIAVPTLFVHGTNDPFGTPDELRAASSSISGPVTHVWIEAGRHDLKGKDQVVARAVATWIAALSAVRHRPD
jgi:uncharacterized protein